MAIVKMYIGKLKPTVDFSIVKCIQVNLRLTYKNRIENIKKIIWLNIHVILGFTGNFSTIKLIRICWLSLAAAEIPSIQSQINKYFPSSVANTCSKCTYRPRIPRNTSITSIMVMISIKYPSTSSKVHLLNQILIFWYFIC